MLLLVVPIAELWVIVQISDQIGTLPTLLLLLLVSVIGAWFLKREGLATWRRLRAAMRRGEVPTKEATDGALILLGGALLLTPGFLTDAVGLVLVFPATRAVVKRSVRGMLSRRVKQRYGVDPRSFSARSRRAGADPNEEPYGGRVVRVEKTPRERRSKTARPAPESQLPSAGHRDDAGGSPGTR